MRFTCNSTCTSLKLLSKVRDDAPSRIQLGDFTRRKPAAAGTTQRPVRPARTAISAFNCSVQRTWRNTFDMYESVAGSPLHHLKLGSSGWTCHVQSYAPRTFFHFAHVASHSIEELFFFSCVRVTFRCVKADNSLAMLLIVFKDGSSTQFCSFEAANIAKSLQVRSSCRAQQSLGALCLLTPPQRHVAAHHNRWLEVSKPLYLISPLLAVPCNSACSGSNRKTWETIWQQCCCHTFFQPLPAVVNIPSCWQTQHRWPVGRWSLSYCHT